MSSLFEEITSCGPRDGAGGDMIAVRSILDSDRFHCFSPVSGRRNFRRCQYHGTDLTLEDIVEREEGEVLFDKLDSGLQGQKAEFQVLDVVDSKGIDLPQIPQAENQDIGELDTQQYLDSLENRENYLLCCNQSGEMRADLYLVTETLETARKETLKTEWQCMLWSWMGGRVCERTSLGPPMVSQADTSPDVRLFSSPSRPP
uniref:Gasdermin pore forming domain-containing protein n=1 Tax=Panthera leo TaxID=9689 RepID=A0A8C8XBH3_PANLE